MFFEARDFRADSMHRKSSRPQLTLAQLNELRDAYLSEHPNLKRLPEPPGKPSVSVAELSLRISSGWESYLGKV